MAKQAAVYAAMSRILEDIGSSPYFKTVGLGGGSFEPSFREDSLVIDGIANSIFTNLDGRLTRAHASL